MQSDVQIEDRVAYIEDDDPFRLEDDSSANARVRAKYAWVSGILYHSRWYLTSHPRFPVETANTSWMHLTPSSFPLSRKTRSSKSVTRINCPIQVAEGARNFSPMPSGRFSVARKA